MRSFVRTFLLLLILIAMVSALFFKVLLARIAGSEEFKHFAEQKIGEYLKAKVHIGEIHSYRFNQIAFEKIIIESPSSKGGSQLVNLDRILFRYHFGQLWNRRFDAPAAVVLNNPTILIDQGQFPYRYFEHTPKNPSGFEMPSLDFNGGEIRYFLPGLNQEVQLTEIDGKVLPMFDQTVRVDVRARINGILTGKVRIKGTILPSKNSHNLSLELIDVNFLKDIPLPFTGINGKVRWVNQDLFFGDLQATLHGWHTSATGSYLSQNGQPGTTLHMRIGKGKPSLKLDLSVDFAKKQLKGAAQIATGPEIHFNGKVSRVDRNFVLDSLHVEPGYHGRGELDFATGNYELIFEQGVKRLAVHSNLRGLEFAFYFHLDHWRVLGLDLVTQGKLFLHSSKLRWKSREFLFKGNFETDYFILEKQPFDDLKGSFEVNPLGVTGIRTTWGEKFKMTGQVLFPDKKPQGKFLLNVSDFDLGLVHEFVAKPLPKEMGGLLEGKLLVEGELHRPEVTGAFNVRNGKWGQLRYDRGIITFRGFAPYFPLEGSKILKGRSTFYLKGAVDFKLDNVFAGVKIETPDRLVIWKGLEAVLHEKDNSMELSRTKLGKWVEFSTLEVRARDAAASANESGEMKNSQEDNPGVQFGTKLKF